MRNSPSPWLPLLTLALLGACTDLSTDSTYKNKEREEIYKHGSLASDEGGIALFGDNKDTKRSDSGGFGVNAFLWRATLDTIAFMPIQSADPFGGLIVTDWYSSPDTPDERTKLNIIIRDRDLRADGLKVTIFRQTRTHGKEWVNADSPKEAATSVENAILTKARQIRMAQKQIQ